MCRKKERKRIYISLLFYPNCLLCRTVPQGKRMDQADLCLRKCLVQGQGCARASSALSPAHSKAEVSAFRAWVLASGCFGLADSLVLALLLSPLPLLLHVLLDGKNIRAFDEAATPGGHQDSFVFTNSLLPKPWRLDGKEKVRQPNHPVNNAVRSREQLRRSPLPLALLGRTPTWGWKLGGGGCMGGLCLMHKEL